MLMLMSSAAHFIWWNIEITIIIVSISKFVVLHFPEKENCISDSICAMFKLLVSLVYQEYTSIENIFLKREERCIERKL